MKPVLAVLGLAAAWGAAAPAAMAANARHPYSNVDRRVDKGGPTGDDQVERLNQVQLDAARAANGSAAVPVGPPIYQPGVPARPMGQ